MTEVSAAEALPPLAAAGQGARPASTGSVAAPASQAPARPVVAAAVPATQPTAVPGKPSIYLQVGAFSDAANASRVADQLNRAGLGPVSVIETSLGGRTVKRVRVGPLADVDTADRVTDQIAKMGLPRPQVAVD
ncbi:SPOR domain-containing protein [Luteibacter sp.]|uniref:SPOR domain-containing protein n=1 Tax=Luteibacter sp. TaxID=1886636 RepID=UPI0025BCF4B5|nr:SPOR domain-containing protein [Luteibacter sp.]